MNLILLSEKDFIIDKKTVHLTDRRFEHIKNVLKANQGDSLCVGLINHKIGTGVITKLDSSCVELQISLNKVPPEPAALNLILALPRPIVLKRLLPAITTLGVKKVVLVNTFRVEKSYWNSPVLSPENIKELLCLGLEQSKDTVVPEVFLRPKFKPFVEDEIPDMIKNTLPLVAHPQSENNLPEKPNKPTTLFIGPEGGFIDYEIETLKSAGFKTVKLGERVLKVETAVISLLSRFII